LNGQPLGDKTPAPAPTFGKDPNDNPYAIQTNPKTGELELKYAPKAPVVNNNIDLREEAKMVAGEVGKNLADRREKASIAQHVIGSVNFATDALENGAKTGGGEEWKQTVRKGLQGFGINLPETAPVEQLQMALFSNVLAKAKEMRPVTDNDIKILQQMGGSIGTDPQALTRALAFAHSMAMKDLQGYHDYAHANENNINPTLRPLFVGATSGYDMPTRIQGPIAFQVETLRQAQRNGMDVSKFMLHDGDKSSPFGEDAKASKFDPTVGFTGINKGVKAQRLKFPLSVRQISSGKKTVTVDQLTPAQKADLLKKLQGG
jgi:hypothetical protein